MLANFDSILFGFGVDSYMSLRVCNFDCILLGFGATIRVRGDGCLLCDVSFGSQLRSHIFLMRSVFVGHGGVA